MAFAAAAFVLVLASAAMTASSASAEDKPFSLQFSGASDELRLIDIDERDLCDACIPDTVKIPNPLCAPPLIPCEIEIPLSPNDLSLGLRAVVTAKAEWKDSKTVIASYAPDKLRQGSTLDLKDELFTTPFDPFSRRVTIRYNSDLVFGVFEREGHGDTSKEWTATSVSVRRTPSFNEEVSCSVPLSNDPLNSCQGPPDLKPRVASFDITLPPPAPPITISITADLPLSPVVDVTGSGVGTVRKASVDGGVAIGDRSMLFDGPSPSRLDDFIDVSCDHPVGKNLKYTFTDNTLTALGNKLSLGVGLDLGVAVEQVPLPDPIPTIPLTTIPLLKFGDVPLTAPANGVDLGPVLVDDTVPVIHAITQAGTFVEGSENKFSAVATDNCPLNYEWRFSDGGVGFGPDTYHRFADDGNYTGTLTVTDQAGNSRTKDFEVTQITNGSPNVIPPPRALAEWGVPVQFHADAVDPGPADQKTLAFRWDFGDGSGAAGADVTHSYADPGTYPVGIAVRDKETVIGTGSTTATISKRDSLLIYTGNTSTYENDGEILFSAVLSDKLGNPLADRVVKFTLSGITEFARTDENGVATVVDDDRLKPGDYTVTAAFTGDIRHESSSTSSPFRVKPRPKLTAGDSDRAVTVSASPTQPVDGIAVVVTARDPGTLVADGTVARVSSTQAARAYRLRRVARKARPNVRTRMRLQLARKDVRAIRRALRSGKSFRARVRVTAIGSGGKRTTVIRRIRLKP